MYKINFQTPIHIYFIGIGGISMSGLAEILLTKGFKVSGSDRKRSPLTESLEKKGALVHYAQTADNLSQRPDLVVYTSAIHPDNPEYAAMKKLGLPSLTRAELLGQIMLHYQIPIAVSGTHGKTTTTSMISEILLHNGSDPTLSIGGIYPPIGGNIRTGGSTYFVTEACEYTNSFLSFYPKIALILNIEEDHLDFFKDLADIRSSFHRFASLLPADGTLIINGNIPHCEEITQGLSCRVLTYASPLSDYCLDSLSYDGEGHSRFTLLRKDGSREEFALKVPGEHNAENALAAAVLADVLGIGSNVTREALLHYAGTDRRFEYKGALNGITIIDDYAHHPTEITATLKAAANIPHQTLWCVFQPHTYTRTRAFLKEFAKALTLADKVVLADIFAARETDTLGISSETLAAEIRELGCECFYFPTFEEIQNFLLENCRKNDLLITMGAGDVVKVGENLLQK